MPFFENASNFKIRDANFVDIGGDQNNYHYDQSLRVSGEGNSANYNKGPQYEGDHNEIHNAGHIGSPAVGRNATVGPHLNATLSEFPDSHARRLQPQPHSRLQETNSAPAGINIPRIQVDQSTYPRNASPQPPSQPSALPQVDHHATAQNSAGLGATFPLTSQSAPSLAGSISGTTLAQSPQPTQTTSSPPLPSSNPATPAPPEASTSQEQNSVSVPVLSEFPELKLIHGATLDDASQEESKDKQKQKKKKKRNFFSRMFRKAPKDTGLSTNA